MNKMTKDELIIYFIEHLGDNHVLGPIMSIEQIRDKLQYLIKDVTYENAPEKAGIACWKPKEGILYFNLGNIEPKKELFIIMHELIHVLATTIETQEVTEPDQSGVRLETRIKSGISYQKYRDNDDKFHCLITLYKIWNRIIEYSDISFRSLFLPGQQQIPDGQYPRHHTYWQVFRVCV